MTAVLSTTSWLTSAKASSCGRLVPGAKQTVCPLAKHIGMTSSLVRKACLSAVPPTRLRVCAWLHSNSNQGLAVSLSSLSFVSIFCCCFYNSTGCSEVMMLLHIENKHEAVAKRLRNTIHLTLAWFWQESSPDVL